MFLKNKSFSFVANLNIKIIYSTSRKFTKYNHRNGYPYSVLYLLFVGGFVCKFVCEFVGWGLCLVLGMLVG